MRRISVSLLAIGIGHLFSPEAASQIPAPAAIPEIKVSAGFEVTRVYGVPRDSSGSWVSLAADDRGRLYASDQYGPLYRIVLPRDHGGIPVVSPLALKIGGAHGLAWINGSLYAATGQKAVCPTGLYRARDTDGDEALDHVELLRALDGDGEHGPHAVVAGPDGSSLYVLAGNGTRLPALDRSRLPPLWAEDSLLAPLPALMGSETRGIMPGGWICRTDLEGRSWELVCAGFRNAYALAFDAGGELFTFDSDTEFEINLPWYRPTRVLHAVSGADFGWRRGALKVPDHAPDNWPSLLPMGLGSPTAVLSARRAKFPAAFRDALWVADWSYGKIFALRLKPDGATFTATREEIVSGMPLPVTAMCVNPADGAIYFTTGGRRLHSALYRLRWTATVAIEPPKSSSSDAAVIARRALESFHGREDGAAIDAAWPALGSADPFIRRAARTAIESQPLATWRGRALKERAPRVALGALLALARTDAPASHLDILTALREIHEASLDSSLRGEWLRVLALTLARAGNVSATTRQDWIPVLDKQFPTGQHEIDAALIELLIFCESPNAAVNGMTALRTAITRQAQLDFAKSLRVLRTSWTPALRREFFEWLGETQSWRGGNSFVRFLQRLRDDAIDVAPETERSGLREQLAGSARKTYRPENSLRAARPAVREWTTDDLAKLAHNDTRKRDPVQGRRVFAGAGCFACHAFDGEGGALGPDLSAAGGRMTIRDLIEAIVEPNREISDQYHTVQVKLRDGRELSGRIVNLTEAGPHLAQNLADPSDVVRLAESDIVAIEPSKHSLMPAGLLNTLWEDEILDLLAFLRGGSRP